MKKKNLHTSGLICVGTSLALLTITALGGCSGRSNHNVQGTWSCESQGIQRVGMMIELRADGSMVWIFQDKASDRIEGTWTMAGDNVNIIPENPMILSFWKRMFPTSTTDTSLTLIYDATTDVLKLPAPLHQGDSGPWVFSRS